MTTSNIPQATFKFTQARLEGLPYSEQGYMVRDSQQSGLVCRVYPQGRKYPAGLKVLQVYKRPKGGAAPVRVKVCKLGDLPLTALQGRPSVRAAVDEILAQLQIGANPNAVERERRAEEQARKMADRIAGITLGQAFDKYVEIKVLRPRTLTGYRIAINRDLGDWKDGPLRSITGAMAVTRHAELVRSSKHTATRAMRVLRAVHRFATDFWGDDINEVPFGRCPVDKVNRVQRQWSQAVARTRKLQTQDLVPWLASVRRLTEEQRRGDGARVALYLELLLLTGLRRREAGFLCWADVDLSRGTLTVRNTKNHRDHALPISKRVRAILEERKRVAGDREHVFGTAECQGQIVRIEKATGIRATPHDLRRSWATFAEKAGLGAYAIKAALNHKTTGDITGIHYTQLDTEDLRPFMQRVEDYILRHAEQREGNVVELHAGGGR